MTRPCPPARRRIGVAVPLLACIACSSGDPADPTGGVDEPTPSAVTTDAPNEASAPPDSSTTPAGDVASSASAALSGVGFVSIEDEADAGERPTRLFALWLRGDATLEAAPLTAVMASGDRCTEIDERATPDAAGLRVASLPDLSIVITTAGGTWATTRESVMAGTTLHRLPGAGSAGPDRLPDAASLALVGGGLAASAVALPAAPASVPLPRFEADGALAWTPPESGATRLVVQVDGDSVTYRCELDDDGRAEFDGLLPTLGAAMVTRVARLIRTAPGATMPGLDGTSARPPLVIERALARTVRITR